MKKQESSIVRICAYPAYWLKEKDSFANSETTIWTASTRTKPGDIHVFAISTDLEDASELANDPRRDAVHSIWEAITKPEYGNEEWPTLAKFKLLVRLDKPVPKMNLIRKGLLKNS